jgi:uncharacterized membrane protein (DUF485 family)
MLTDEPPDERINRPLTGNGSEFIHTPASSEDAPDTLSTSLYQLRAKIDRAEDLLNQSSRNRTLALGLGTPLFVLSLALLAAYEDNIFQYAPELGKIVGFGGRILLLWLLAALIVSPIYYFIFHKNFVYARDALNRLEQRETARLLFTEEGRRQHFREELFRLTGKAAQVFYDDARRFKQASEWGKKAGNILEGKVGDGDLNDVQSCINSLNELVTREEREQKDERYWQYAAVATMLVYVALLVAAALYTIKHPENLGAPILGIPLSIVLWGAAGSLAAILYRFYTEQGRIRLASEFRWLIARPVIGIIMGAVVFLAFYSGLILMGSEGGYSGAPAPGAEIEGTAIGAGAETMAGIGERKVFWVIAFLAGFSDKVYLGVIDLLVARTVRSQEVDSNTVITEKERIPDNSSGHEEDS